MTTTVVHDSAHLHVAGEATYVDDIAPAQGTLHAALYLSEQAHAKIVAIDYSAVLASDGVRAIITADDIIGENDCAPILADDPILAQHEVQYAGQAIFAVVADSYLQARKAVKRAKVEVQPLEAVFDVAKADQQQQWVLPPMQLQKGDAETALANAPRQMAGEFSVGGQEHFYLEGQIAYAVPQEDGCLQLWCSTQHPTEMQHLVAQCLQRDASQIVVEMRRMGGGFGGKESQSALISCVAAIAANKLQRPVRLRLDRDDDMRLTGKRHGFQYHYAAGFDDAGKLTALKLNMRLNAGYSADLSGPVATRALCHVDNAYQLDALFATAHCCKTNTQSNTAFRGFGGPQGAFATEYILDNIAREIGQDALDVRRHNFYPARGGMTPYGQMIEDNVIHELVEQLEKSSDYRARRQAIAAFNAQSPVIRKGLALTPVKFGISFNVVHFNQAGALVHVYTDGSVRVNHGGTEMGQGLHTKVAMVVAQELGLDIKSVRVTATDTSKVANTSATAASTGSDLNAKAAQDAACQIRQRLVQFITRRFGGDESAIRFENNRVHGAQQQWSFRELVQLAYQARVQLWSDGFYKTPDLHWDKDTLHGSPFYYYAYGAAVSEVAVDTLTGEARLLAADLLHDAGHSINPAIDRGQVEGAFIQGMGWLTTEQLCWDDAGRLTTHAPSTYKIPAISDCPPRFNVELFDNANVKDSILRSKAVGEPPLLLGFSVFFAIRDAIASVAQQRINPPLNAPATAQEILRAVEACRG